MSNYERFLAYMDAYEGEEKIKNVGFAKVEEKAGYCFVEMKIRGACGGSPAEVLAARWGTEGAELVPLGVIRLGAGEGEFSWRGESVGASGLLIRGAGQRCCYTTWGTRPIPLGAVMSPQKKAPTAAAAPKTEKKADPVSRPSPEMTVRSVQVQTLPEQSGQIPTPISKRGLQRPEGWDGLCKLFPKRLPAPGWEAWEVLEIQLQDIGRLPRRTWVYGNNSFLVQGHARHGYLVLLSRRSENGKREYRLGVPGQNNETEKMLAGLFGFAEFMPGKRKVPDFGYWCTEVSLEND